MTPLPLTRVLRPEASAVSPYVFAPLGPLDAPPPPTPAPSPDEAFAEGRAAGLAERDAELAALHAEAERTAAALAAALAEAHAAAGRTANLVAQATETLQAGWQDAVRALEADLAALALDAAEAVLDAPLGSTQRVAVADAITDAVEALADGAPLTVALHPVDLLHLQDVGLADSLSAAHPGLRWEPDATLAEGDWAVSTPDAAVRRVRADMMAALRDRLGLDA